MHLNLTTLPSLYMKCVVCIKPGASGCSVIPSSRRTYTVEYDSAAHAHAHTLKQLTKMLKQDTRRHRGGAVSAEAFAACTVCAGTVLLHGVDQTVGFQARGSPAYLIGRTAILRLDRRPVKQVPYALQGSVNMEG